MIIITFWSITFLGEWTSSKRAKMCVLCFEDEQMSCKRWQILKFTIPLINREEEWKVWKSCKDIDKNIYIFLYKSATTSFLISSLCRLCKCSIGEEGCFALASALRSNPLHLRELNLSLNKPGISVKFLSDLLEDTNCKLESLKF